MVVERDEGTLLVAFGVDAGTHVHRFAPTAFHQGAAPDVHAAVAVLAVADEVERLAVDGEAGLRLPPAGVDGGTEVLGLAPAARFAVGDIEVAASGAVGTATGGEVEYASILRDAAGALVVVAVEGLGHADGLAPFAVNQAAVVEVLRHRGTVVAGEEECASVGGEGGQILVVGAVDGRPHVHGGEGHGVGHGLAAESDTLQVVLGTGSPAFVLPFVGAEKGTQMLLGEVEAVVVH